MVKRMATPSETRAIIEHRVRPLKVVMGQRDPYTYDHGNRVDKLSLALGIKCGLSEMELNYLYFASLFHDIGKIGIPDSVLLKPGALNDEEWAIMKTHSEKAEQAMLAIDYEGCDIIGSAVRHHHENFDGYGYPDGLSGEAIPILARILSITDTYDAMARKRSYAAAKPHKEIMEVLLQERGLQHDPYLSAKFEEFIDSPQGIGFRAGEDR
jgi:HD-GYP domain-containing protein (c-di-GMP phosphodiesterase class II)